METDESKAAGQEIDGDETVDHNAGKQLVQILDKYQE
ncbi:DUF3140 domain-containing protein [Nonlabens spongiae]